MLRSKPLHKKMVAKQINMEQKKRHNPEITEQDLAVNAFDRLESIVQEAKNSSQSVETVKTDGVLMNEFYSLIKKIFGEEFYEHNKSKRWQTEEELLNDTRGLFNVVVNDPEFAAFVNEPRTFYKNKKNKWYQKKMPEKYITLKVDAMDEIIKSDAGEKINFLVQKGKYNPIEITAHTTEALKEARIFVTAYQNLTGQKATLIQDCEDEEPVKEVEEKVKEPSKLGIILRAVGKEVSGDLKKAKETLTDEDEIPGDLFQGCVTAVMMPFCTYGGIRRIARACEYHGEPSFHAVIGGMGGFFTLCTGLGVTLKMASEGDYIPLAVVGTTQALDTVGRYVVSVARRVKNGKY